jgi:integrase
MTATLCIKKERPNYFVLIRYKDETTGKERQRWVSTDIPVKGNNKRKADEKLKEVLSDFGTQQLDLSKDVLFDVFLENWLESSRHSIEQTTYDAYKLNIDRRIIPFFRPKKIRLRDLTPAHIQQFVNHCLKTVSANTVRKYLANISKCLDNAVKQSFIAFNPVKRIDLPKKVKYTGAKFFNEKQIEALIEGSKSDPLETVILLTVFYGLRRSEAIGIKWDSVDFVNDTIAIRHTVVCVNKVTYKKDSTKNDSSNDTLAMPGIIKDRLLRQREEQDKYRLLLPNDYVDEGYVCTQPDGNVIKPNYVSQHFKLLLKRIGLPDIRFHDLRHSAASYLL